MQIQYLTDTEALNAIEDTLSRKEWDADTSARVATIVRLTGRVVEEVDDEDDGCPVDDPSYEG